VCRLGSLADLVLFALALRSGDARQHPPNTVQRDSSQRRRFGEGFAYLFEVARSCRLWPVGVDAEAFVGRWRSKPLEYSWTSAIMRRRRRTRPLKLLPPQRAPAIRCTRAGRSPRRSTGMRSPPASRAGFLVADGIAVLTLAINVNVIRVGRAGLAGDEQGVLAVAPEPECGARGRFCNRLD
jgi:hypothetical protein